MKYNRLRLGFAAFFGILMASFMNGQFRTRDRMENFIEHDEKKFTYGFFLAINSFDYKLVLDPKYGMDPTKNHNLIHSKTKTSFGAGLMGRMRLNESFDLRLEPGLQFVERDLQFDIDSNPAFIPASGITITPDMKNRTVKSTYVDIPLLLEFHGDRWYNSRPYAAAGVNYLINLQSNQKSENDNLQNTFRSTTHNFGWTAEIGIQLYFSRFKLTPAVRGTFFTNNELVKDNPETPPYWAGGISSAQTRAFMFVLKFE